jgi:alpha-glucosidase
LRTYLYSALWQSHKAGLPILRPLFFLDQGDPRLYNISDQFLFGDHLMICPVVRFGQRKRMVVFPEGEWIDFETGERHGKGEAVIDAPLDRILVFVRAGAVIPWDIPSQFDQEGEIEQVELLFFEGDQALKTLLYFDDGTTCAYESGEYRESWVHVEDGSLREEILHDQVSAPLMTIKNKR